MGWERLIEFAVGLVLAMGVLAKARRPSTFAEAIRQYGFLSNKAAPPVAYLLIGFEAVVGVLMLSSVAPALALPLGSLLFLAFAVASWLHVATHGGAATAGECGCLGGSLRLRHSVGASLLNLGVSAVCGAATVSVLSSSSSDDLGAGLIVGMATLLGFTYWLAHYAISVLGEIQANAESSET